MNQSEEYKNYLEELIRQKPYKLHPEVEKTLAAFSSVSKRAIRIVQYDEIGRYELR